MKPAPKTGQGLSCEQYLALAVAIDEAMRTAKNREQRGLPTVAKAYHNRACDLINERQDNDAAHAECCKEAMAHA